MYMATVEAQIYYPKNTSIAIWENIPSVTGTIANYCPD